MNRRVFLINTILSRDEFLDAPPILIDIGASGYVNPKWNLIAKHSICVAFDADSRELGYTVSESDRYKKLYVFNSLVTDKAANDLDFYLTNLPQCSSLLEPDHSSIENWSFSNYFQIKDTVKLCSTDLNTVLNELNLERIDWFKTDSQGIDLRLFKSLSQGIADKILVAEFEPGIIDAYSGEDKLYALMAYMQDKPFWMSDLDVRGSQRISRVNLEKYFSSFHQKNAHSFIKTSPGWAGITYINDLTQDLNSKREYLLAWIFSIIEEQYGYALDVSQKAYQKFDDPIFSQLEKFTISQINLAFYKGFPALVISKALERLGRFMGLSGG
jgi:hypothetical protein